MVKKELRFTTTKKHPAWGINTDKKAKNYPIKPKNQSEKTWEGREHKNIFALLVEGEANLTDV